MHVLTPTVFELLDELVRENIRELGQIQLTTALERPGPKRAIPRARNPGLAASTWASSSAWSRPRSRWPWRGVDRERILALLLESMVRDRTEAGSLIRAG